MDSGVEAARFSAIWTENQSKQRLCCKEAQLKSIMAALGPPPEARGKRANCVMVLVTVCPGCGSSQRIRGFAGGVASTDIRLPFHHWLQLFSGQWVNEYAATQQSDGIQAVSHGKSK